MSRRSGVPRVVVVTRRSDYEKLLFRHATRQQAEFFLATRRQSIDDVQAQHERVAEAVHTVTQAIPLDWRRTRVLRGDLDRFLFEPGDLVVAVGQDGLVANLAKYLDGQPVIGINPDSQRYDGVLARHRPDQAARLLQLASTGRVAVEERTMVEARTDDAQRVLALNEVFIGHRSHQSARYRIRWRGANERQSSSGMIVTTGTGATGWARSVHRQRRTDVVLPSPCERRLAFFVREAFPSVATMTTVTDGDLRGDELLEVRSEMNEGGVLFGDGIEADRIAFHWGITLTIGLARTHLHLLVGAGDKRRRARRPRAAVPRAELRAI